MKARISQTHFNYFADALKKALAEFHKRNSGVSDADIVRGKLLTELNQELRSVVLRFFRIIPPGSKTPITPEDAQEFKLTIVNRAMIYGLNAQLNLLENERLFDEALKAVFEIGDGEIDNGELKPDGKKAEEESDEAAAEKKPMEFRLAGCILPVEEGEPGIAY